MQDMLETGSQHAAAVGMHINASNYSYLVNSYPVIDGEPFEEVDKIKCLGLTLIASGQGGTDEIRSRIDIACSAFNPVLVTVRNIIHPHYHS